MGELEKYGVPVRVIERWRQRQGEQLLPVQRQVVHKRLLGLPGEPNERKEIKMIISAPTSSGKSFCAEMAAMQSLTARQKVIMLFPLKSLAEQKYKLFQETYQSLGIKTIIVTSEHPENDMPFLLGDYHIAVCIYEKFDLFLTASLDRLKTIGLIVVDEIQTIAEPGRGAILERLLTKVKSSIYRPSIVGLSAVIGDDCSAAGQLAGWLDATLVEERQRPVELIRGVAAEGTFRYRSFNKGDDGEEPFARSEVGDDPFTAFASQLKKSSGSTLVFLKSRMETVEAAFKLAASVDWAEAKKAIADLADEEPSFLTRSLRQALSRGVAFHNADLTQSQRKVIEKAFVGKEVKVLFSTTTLAMGVNLSADSVYLETVKYSSGKYTGKPTLVPVSRAEFDNMTGRAGRLESLRTQQPHRTNNDQMQPVGKAIILAQSEFDRDILWDNYIATNRSDEIKSAFHSLALEDWLLDMIASGLLQERSDATVGKLFQQTYCAQSETTDMTDRLRAGFDILVGSNMVTVDEVTSELVITPLGRAVAKSGLAVKEACYYCRKIGQSQPRSAFGWLALLLSGSDWSLPPSILSRYEQAQNGPMQMLFQMHDNLADQVVDLLGEDYRRKPLSYRQAASLKALLLLEQWRNLVPVQKLEERFQMHLGQVMYMGETAAYLLYAAGELLAATNRETGVKEELADIAFSVRYGLPVEFRDIHKYFKGLINRADYVALQNAGIVMLDDFCRMDKSTQVLLFSGGDKVKRINEKIELVKEEVQMEPRTNNSLHTDAGIAPILFAEPELIEIDGSYERERYLVKINGFPVRLTGKSFKYFTKLAWSRLNGESGWIYKEEIEHGFNQARYLYRMKGEIGRGLNSDWPIFENNRLGYYRLNAAPAKIKINIDNLKNHPDYEIREMIETGSVGRMN